MEKIRFQKNSDEMMRVISEQKKSLYLKAYVGSVYKDGVWRKTPYKDGVWRKTPEGQDPLQWFLTTSRTGNQMLYVSAAVEAFRAHGIPARYVEGYYLGVSKIQDSKNGEVSITGENAHAWVEVYFDGVGWKAVDVTPGYYYNVATLQKMVNTPEQIKKNAAMILLGAVTVLVIAGFILFVILEIRLWLLEQTLKKQYEQADMD
ncbi:transglutaminase-like domain-containing protein [Anaerostipes hadrus]|uniref:transglutaminase-like domain-containing protein n=1 Tax=Anaerostipes hadrus TaxID=649756 RepID=UPI00156FD776|nr:transglutaminase-like domain-containing protein [Anaerostipes hadrus]NSJ73933.1 transglutaminase domain-containing protein [Anaerostipes hadrus]